MNLLLFRARELDPDNGLVLRGRRLEHIRCVLKSDVGDRLRVGEINGLCGTAVIENIDGHSALLRISLSEAPPPPLDVTLVLALPRPKMLRRILRGVAELGIKSVYLINSYRVEKSFWHSPALRSQQVEEALLAGLEQSRDTVLPEICLQQRFRPFADDLLPTLCAGRVALLADHRSDTAYPGTPPSPALLIVGPEGGFIPFEISLLREAGAIPVSLGPRPLRVETALHCALGRHLHLP